MKTRFLSTTALLIILSLLVAACVSAGSPTKMPVATEQVEPTQPVVVATVPPVPTAPPVPTDPPAPTATEVPEFVTESVDVGQGFWFTYDPSYWEVGSPTIFPYLVARNDSACRVRYQFGHGMDPDRFEFSNADETIGGTVFSVSRWTSKTTGEPVLIAFHYTDLDFFSVEGPRAEILSEECVEETYKMIELSVGKGFSQ